MTTKKDAGAAFPHLHGSGMTLRDYFAGQALVGLMMHVNPYSEPSLLANDAYKTADAMVAEREKG